MQLQLGGRLDAAPLRRAMAMLTAEFDGPLDVHLAGTHSFSPSGVVSLLCLVDRATGHGRAVTVRRSRSPGLNDSLLSFGVARALEDLGARHDLGPAPRRESTAFGLVRFEGTEALEQEAERVHDWADASSSKEAAQLFETISELGQNVLQHSGRQHGYLAVARDGAGAPQFAVADVGVGFRESLQRRGVRSERAALDLALQPGSTETDDDGRGRGLAWLAEKTSRTGGRLVLVSGNASVSVVERSSSDVLRSFSIVPASIPGALVEGTVALIGDTPERRRRVA